MGPYFLPVFHLGTLVIYTIHYNDCLSKLSADDLGLCKGMILAENLHVNTERRIVPKKLKMNCLRNGETETSLRRQNDQVQYQSSNGRCGNFDGSNARPCYDENCGEKNISGISNNSSENQGANSHADSVGVSVQHGCESNYSNTVVGNSASFFQL